MSDISYAHREDRSCSGFFEWTHTGVRYGHEGIQGLKHYAIFDQGPWLKVDTSNIQTYSNTFDAGTGRVTDSVEATLGAGTTFLYRRMRLPADFGSWINITLFTSKSSIASGYGAFNVSLYKGSVVDPLVNQVSVMPTTADTWEQFTLDPNAGYLPGDFVTFVVKMEFLTLGAHVFLADWTPTYRNAVGNV